MKLVERFWTTATVVVNWSALSPFEVPNGPQSAISPKIDSTYAAENIRVQNLYNIDPALEYKISHDGKGPEFKPPTGRPKGRPGSDLECQYPSLGPDWIPCSTAANRECWLRNYKTGEQYNITTDYEKFPPPGVVRNYTLVLSNKTINADGIEFPYGKVFGENFPEGGDFDGTFPGPLIQACWGDILNVTVYNRLPYDNKDFANGTSIHWHGLRQLNTMQFDGVNGITQCPIAPNDHYTYTFPVMQYGSTWYHSHYSMQYADGTQGPLMLHGPTSAPFDHPLKPLIITDWGHNSAFAASYVGLKNPSIVLNGRGNINRFSGTNINTTVIPDSYHVTFEPEKRYLLRIINTAFETGFTFSIDGHTFDIVENDLVPIEPILSRKSIVVHIGQRYNVVVQAKKKSEIGDGNFWIRTTTCYTDSINHGLGEDWMKTGIVRYNDQSRDDPTDKISIPWQIPDSCEDEALGNIHPKHKWTVGPSKNSIIKGENIAVKFDKTEPPYIHASFLWDIKETKSNSKKHFQIHYDDPIFLRLDAPKPRPEEVVVYSSDNFTENDWAYIVIKGASNHPIHLHGHDFAVVYQSDKSFSSEDIKSTCPDNKKFTCDNPPRRDVIKPRQGTYVVIAFKTDNPGSWLLHCHIASHAGAGLDLQILERPQEAAAMWPPGSSAFVETQRVCKHWDKWWNDTKIVQDDSGV